MPNFVGIPQDLTPITKLMEAAQKLAKESGCNFMAVNTMDWEALDFYKKLGFYVEFERRGFDKNSIFYFLRKDLDAT
jgi:ribosomal protein S18 acetylase RimI-like enzyme